MKSFFLFFRHFFSSTQNTIAIDQGTDYIKIVQLQKKRGGYELTDYKVRAIPHKVKDDPAEKEKFLEEFLKEYISQSRVKTSLGRIAVKNQGVYIFSFSLPALNDKDLRGAVGIELKKRLPYQADLDKITFNYEVTDRSEGENPQVMVTCIAVENDDLDKQVEILKKSTLRPMAVYCAQDCLGNLLQKLEAKSDCAILEMGVKRSFLNFYKNSQLRFSREIPVGGDHFTQSLLKSMLTLKGDITFEEAETFKCQCGLPLQEDADKVFYTDFGALKGGQITTAVRTVLERFLTEVSRTVSFYFRTYKVRKLDTLYLTGGASRIKNIDRFLMANVSSATVRSVELLQPLKAVSGWKNVGVMRQEMMLEEAAPHLGVAVGLCLDKGGKFNFLPLKERLEQKAMFVMFVTKLIAPVMALLLIAFYAYCGGRAKFYDIVSRQTQKSIEEYQPTLDKIQEYFDYNKKLQEGEVLLKQAVGKQPLLWGVMKELSNITPGEVTLHRLSIAAGEFPRKMVLVGEVMSEFTNLNLALSQYTINLEDSPYFSNVKLISQDRDQYSSTPKSAFELSCELKL